MYVYFYSLHVSAATCPSSGELIVSIHLVYVTLKTSEESKITITFCVAPIIKKLTYLDKFKELFNHDLYMTKT
jgi:hypothetical protein